jgi:release factor glutamine methyltransferase
VNNQNIQQWLKQAQQQLSLITDAFIEESHLILCDALNQNTAYLIAHSQDSLSPVIQHKADNYLQQRLTDTPLAYILGHANFYGLPIIVNPHVLIPRNDTESLIEYVLTHYNTNTLKIADLGTGSGAIACTLAHNRPQWEIIATDISDNALTIAKQNAKHLKANNITFTQSNWFNNLTEQYFDIIISNPPYIDFDDPDTDFSVKNYEPHQALFSKDNGLADIEILLKEAKNHLKSNGLLIIEHGHLQQEKIISLAKDHGFSYIQGHKDLSGLNRYIVAKL